MRVRTEIVALRDDRERELRSATARSGERRARRVSRRSRWATPMACRASSPTRGHVLVRGKRAPIVGAVSMDMAMIDVTDIDGADVRDEVVVLGAQEGPLGRGAIGADEIAAHAGTIAWEVLTTISRRVPRFYREP